MFKFLTSQSSIFLQKDGCENFPPPFDEFLSDIECFGVRSSSTIEGREYAVISARSNNRWWLLPLDDAKIFRAGLEMYHPISPIGNFGKSALRFATYVAPSNLWAGKRICLNGNLSLTKLFGHDTLNVSYFTGTDGPHRKTSAQIITPDGHILGYAKISQRKNVMAYIEKEAQALKMLSNLHLQSCKVPTLLDFSKNRKVCYLATETLRTMGNPVTLELGARHIAFIRELHSKTGKLGAQQLISALRKLPDKTGRWLPDDWQKRFFLGLEQLEGANERIPVSFSHGDFTPWNCFVSTQGLYIFDWEYAKRAPLGNDLIHFMLSTRQSEPSESLVDLLRRSMTTSLYQQDSSSVDDAMLLSLLMHTAFYLNRLYEVGNAASGWQEAQLYASLIDFLLSCKSEY